jgi:AraC-like DNA-binding protein
MRQIVQLDRPIVQNVVHQESVWPMSAGISGRADAIAWRGGCTKVEWDLSSVIGFVLVTDNAIEAQCAAGNKTLLVKGDLLILNESSASALSAATAFFLNDAALVAPIASITPADVTPIRALHGSIQPANARWDHRPFADKPAWSMAVARLNEREYTRVATIAQLLANEAGPLDDERPSTRLVANLEATLFEALAGVLWARDPLSLPQLVACGDKRIAKALVAISEAPAKPWRIDTMAREAAMSRTAFAMQFKKIVGKTPLDYLTGLRLQFATTLLENSPVLSIDCIARDVGYADESALRRAYTRVTGESFKRRGEARHEHASDRHSASTAEAHA